MHYMYPVSELVTNKVKMFDSLEDVPVDIVFDTQRGQVHCTNVKDLYDNIKTVDEDIETMQTSMSKLEQKYAKQFSTTLVDIAKLEQEAISLELVMIQDEEHGGNDSGMDRVNKIRDAHGREHFGQSSLEKPPSNNKTKTKLRGMYFKIAKLCHRDKTGLHNEKLDKDLARYLATATDCYKSGDAQGLSSCYFDVIVFRLTNKLASPYPVDLMMHVVNRMQQLLRTYENAQRAPMYNIYCAAKQSSLHASMMYQSLLLNRKQAIKQRINALRANCK